MRCFYVLKKWSSAKLSLNRDLSLNKVSLNRDCTVLFQTFLNKKVNEELAFFYELLILTIFGRFLFETNNSGFQQLHNIQIRPKNVVGYLTIHYRFLFAIFYQIFGQLTFQGYISADLVSYLASLGLEYTWDSQLRLVNCPIFDC